MVNIGLVGLDGRRRRLRALIEGSGGGDVDSEEVLFCLEVEDSGEMPLVCAAAQSRTLPRH